MKKGILRRLEEVVTHRHACLYVLFFLYMVGVAWAASTKLADLTADTSLGMDSLLYTVDDPAGAPADRKITVQELADTVIGDIVVGDITSLGIPATTDVPLDSDFSSNGLMRRTGAGTYDVLPLGTLTDTYLCIYSTASGIVCNTVPSTFLQSLAADTTPQAGGDLDLNSHNLKDALGRDDDDCTGDQGNFWWDSTDNQWEGCNANSGIPVVLGGGSATAFNNIGTASGAANITLGAYQHLFNLNVDTSAWRAGTPSNHLEVVNSGGTDVIVRLVGSNITANLGTFTVSTDSVHAQTGTTADDDMYQAAYDVDGASYVNMFTLKAGNTVYGYLGGQTNGIRWDENGGVALLGTANLNGVNNTELGYLSTVSSNVQTQLDAKAPLTSPVFLTDITLPYSTSGDGTLTQGKLIQKSDEDAISLHGGASGEVQDEALISLIHQYIIPFDPETEYDTTTNHVISIDKLGDEAPHGITITEWSVEYINGDPTTELDMDIICDTTPDWDPAAGATVMDVIDTTAGVSSADTGFDSATCANGSNLYLRFGADPVDSGERVHVEINYYLNED